MSALSMTCFLVCFGILISSFRKGADVFSPGRVFGFTWCFVLALTDLKLSRLQHEWSGDVWAILLFGPAAFLLGVFIMYVQNVGSVYTPLDEMRLTLRSEQVNERRLFGSIVVLFVMYGVSYFVIYLIKGYVPLLSPEGILFRTEFTAFGVGLFIHLMPVILVCVLVYHVVFESAHRHKTALKIIAAITALSFLLLLQRFHFIMSAVICIPMLYYSTRVIRLKTASIFILATVALFYWVSSLRTGELIQYYLYLSSKMKFSYHYALLTEPYMYFVMNLENYARSIELHQDFTFGAYTFDFVAAVTGLKHWLRSYFLLEDNPYLVSGYNTYTAFWTFYRDFGIAGLGTISLMLGAMTGYLHARLRLRPSVLNLTSYAIAIFMMVISFFNFPFSLLWFILVIALIIMVLHYIAGVKDGPGTAGL